MKKIDKKTKFNIKQLTAIERIASDPSYSSTKLAKELKVNVLKVRDWKNNISFISAVYDRFMDVAGKHMPDVIMAQIREAKAGNTQAATLVLKHFGKFQDTITLKIESPFDQFLKTKNVEEAEIVEETVENGPNYFLTPGELGNSFELPEATLPERDPINDKPKARIRKENKKIKKIYKKQKYLDNRNERYRWLKRANRVNIKPLGRGRPSPDKLRSWHNSIIEAENKLE